MNDEEIIDKINGAETSVAFAKIKSPNDKAQTTRLNVESFVRVIEILKTMEIKDIYITVEDEGNIILRLRKNSDIAIVVSPFAALREIA